jgi:aspartate dehydrogenase
MSLPHKLGMIGCGAIGNALRLNLRSTPPPIEVGAVLVRNEPGLANDTAAHFRGVQDLIAWAPSLVVECAGHAAVKDVVPPLLKSGTSVIVLSIGSFADPQIFDAARHAAAEGGSRLIAATGAIGGIDALRSARAAGLAQVNYVGRKPSAAWAGSPAAKAFDLGALTKPTVVFEGDATAAAQLYPKNANVTAAVALAGIGFTRTKVTLVADPGLSRNVHELQASGAFGTMKVVLENEALPGNPKSSWLAALNAEYLVRREISRLEV